MKTGVTVISFFLILSLYFGIGGIMSIDLNAANKQIEQAKQTDNVAVIYDGITFKNKGAMQQYLQELKKESLVKFFWWIDDLTDFGALIITACFFGMLGGIISIVNDITINNKKIEDLHFYSTPISGFLTGFVVLAITYLIPTLLVEKSDNIRSVSLMFLCLFGGIKSKEFYEKIDKYFSKLFK